jgi:hypothetical protein
MRISIPAATAFFVWFFCLFSYGQSVRQTGYVYEDNANFFGKNNVSLSMLPVFKNGFELNYDRKIIDKHWVKLAPIYYRTEDYTLSVPEDLMRVKGYGFKFQHKYFPYNHIGKQFGIFMSYGPGFQSFELTTKGREFVKFDKYGFECVIGVRKVVYNVFYFELYSGLASACLKNRSDETVDIYEVLKKNNTWWFDYGVTGNYFLLGINLGVLF